jgi:hypothetical protein
MMLKGKIVIGFGVIAASTLAVLGQGGTPNAIVGEALVYEQHHDTTFNRRNINSRKKWITPELYRLFLAELAREERETREHPDEKPYFGDGLSFGPLKELCEQNGRVYRQQFSVRKAKIVGRSATVPVSFFYHRACGGRPVIYRFKLVRRHSRWRIDDIDYGSNETLRKALRRAS